MNIKFSSISKLNKILYLESNLNQVQLLLMGKKLFIFIINLTQ